MYKYFAARYGWMDGWMDGWMKRSCRFLYLLLYLFIEVEGSERKSQRAWFKLRSPLILLVTTSPHARESKAREKKERNGWAGIVYSTLLYSTQQVRPQHCCVWCAIRGKQQPQLRHVLIPQLTSSLVSGRLCSALD